MPLLEMKNIRKAFFGVEVLHNVNFSLNAGEILALIGENGAGKSTLMKILMGEYSADEGEIYLDGELQHIHTPFDALQLGINKVHQELSPVRDMTVTDNIFLGREIRKNGIVNYKEEVIKAKEIFENLGINIDPTKMMRQLSVAQTQMVEIAKAVSFKCKVLILDEPTTAITNVEVEKLFDIMRLLRSQGVGIIYISHKLEELYAVSDRITVLRDGNHIITDTVENIPTDKLIHAMVGREIKDLYPKKDNVVGEPILEVRNLSRNREYHDISFTLHKGEILGLSGLMGAGRTEICMSLFGATKPDSGEIYLNGKKLELKCPKDAIRNKIALLTEDRKLQGLNLIGSVQDNVLSAVPEQISKFGFVLKKKSYYLAKDMVEKLRTKIHSMNQLASNLSGGNQQKLVIAKWSLTDPDVIIFDEPTRGVDVGAKSEIYKLMNDFAKQGKAVIMVSSEMPEIIGMCDRVLVLHEGRMTGELSREEMDQDRIMTLATS